MRCPWCKKESRTLVHVTVSHVRDGVVILNTQTQVMCPKCTEDVKFKEHSPAHIFDLKSHQRVDQ